MRVYEFAKKVGVANKEVIEILTTKGFEVSSHMSALAPDALQFLEASYDKNSSAESAPKKTVKAPEVIVEAVPVREVHVVSAPAPAATVAAAAVQPVKTQPTPAVAQESAASTAPQGQIVAEPMTLAQFAEHAQKPVGEIILNLLKKKLVYAKNQVLSDDLVKDLARQYNLAVVAPTRTSAQAGKVAQVEHGEQRLPVVVVIGHVDHGKTTLLDFVRKTRVASREKGGITQHLGAYRVTTSHGDLVFLDTPGHAAFSKMRGRGVRVADIAILVVAADDGVMPQTVEAVKHAQAVNTPIIVAVNKMDKAEAGRIDVVKRELAQYNLLPEEWGGQTLYVPISAKTGQGIDGLLEMVVLQSHMMELKADRSLPAAGFLLEARLERGRGPVATVITHQGILKVGDYIAAGKAYGKVSALIDAHGSQVRSVEPSVPVQVSGFTELPESGDVFEVIAEKEFNKMKGGQALESRINAPKSANEDTFNIILKADAYSSQEALLDAIAKIPQKNAQEINVVHAAVGPVSESDVVLAHTTNSVIFTFHVKVDANAVALAHKDKVGIKRFDVIYHLLEALEECVKKAQKIPMVSKKIGEAVVRKVFDIKNLGVIAGSYVKDGRFAREGTVVGWRGKQKLGGGLIKSLERDRKSVKEVHAGFEFAFLVDSFNDWQIDDRVECFIEVPATPV
jgi:translation initiation factor IF-2